MTTSLIVTGSAQPTTYLAPRSAAITGFEGVPKVGVVDQLIGDATFIGGSGNDSFILNGSLIAEGSSGGNGNTYIIPVASTSYGGGTSGHYGVGTLEDRGSGNTVFLDDGTTKQKLTSLTINQFIPANAYDFDNVPIATGVTNTR